ncbi:hypothetical protein [Streptomyces sp. PD-S100-1]|uniref:hypothetical protein n=1 Tax=Streptomyces sp. PD-S100-1 TaxID=3394351 RepID=UPI0039BCD8CF
MPLRGPVIVVLAENRTEFERWCVDSGLRRNDPEVVFADREDRLRGMTGVKIIRCRYWWAHPDAERINLAAQIIEQRST